MIGTIAKSLQSLFIDRIEDKKQGIVDELKKRA
jgi:hypothetical protein